MLALQSSTYPMTETSRTYMGMSYVGLVLQLLMFEKTSMMKSAENLKPGIPIAVCLLIKLLVCTNW